MHPQLKIFIYLIIPPILWSGNNIVGKLAGDFIGPYSLSFFRWLIASTLILIFAARPLYEARTILREHYRIIVLLGILGTGAFNTLLYLGLTQTSANNSAIILAGMPIAIIGLSFILGQERATAKQILGMLLSLAGVAWVISKGDLAQLVKLQFNRGDLIVFVALIVWAFYSVLLRNHRPPEIKALPFLAAQILIGTLFVFPFYLLEQATHAPIIWQQETFFMLAYVGVFPSLIAYYFWQQGIALGGANLAGLISPSISLFTAIFAYLILHETLNDEQLIGALLIVVGVLIAFMSASRTPIHR